MQLAEKLVSAFKDSPGTLALMIVIYFLFRLIHKREDMMQELIEGQYKDADRQSKMLTLLEILVSKQKVK